MSMMKFARSVIFFCSFCFTVSSLNGMISPLYTTFDQATSARIMTQRMGYCKQILGCSYFAGFLAVEFDHVVSFVQGLAVTIKKEALLPDQEHLDAMITERFCKYFKYLTPFVELPNVEILQARLSKVTAPFSDAPELKKSIDAATKQLAQLFGSKKIVLAALMVAIEHVVSLVLKQGLSIDHDDAMRLELISMAVLLAAIFEGDDSTSKSAFEVYMKLSGIPLQLESSVNGMIQQ